MPEYIEREKLKEALCPYSDTNYAQDMDTILRIVDELPAADVATVVHGRWTEIDASYWRWKQSGHFPVHLIKYKHDKCGEVVSKKEDYCPGCGAKMDLGD